MSENTRRNSSRKTVSWRTRLPVIAVVVVAAAAVTAAVTGAAKPLPGMRVVPGGHWVYNSVLQAAFHLDGGTAGIDAQAAVPGDQGSQVVQGDTNGYVVGDSRISRFGKSDLTAGPAVAPPSKEVPLGLETAGGPYLVYRQAGQVVRLGDPSATMSAGGPISDAVATADGTVWLLRAGSGLICRLDQGADRVTSCPVVLPAGHTGSLTVVGDQPHFVDTTDATLRAVGTGGLGDAVSMGLAPSANLRPAANDVSGRVPLLDQQTNRLYLVDPAPKPQKPVAVQLPAGQYDGPVAGGSVVALVDRSSGTLLTFDGTGKQADAKPIPPGAGTSRLDRGEDSQVYVEGGQGTHVLVVGKDGKVTDVPVVPPPVNKPDQPAPGQPAPPQPGTLPPVEQRGTGDAAPKPDVNAGNKPGPARTPEKPAKPAKPPAPPAVPASPPGAPPSVSATGGAGSATVSWGAAAANRATVTSYQISWSGGSKTVGGGTRQASIPGLSNGTRYTFTVVAVNKAGTGPGASASATPAASASAPGLTATYRNGGASLSWTQPDLGGGQLVNYLVTGTGQAQQTVSGTTATYSGLAAGKSYTFTVRAVTKTPDGETRNGATASKSITVPAQSVSISRGAKTSSSNCSKDCYQVNVSMTGFEANTKYDIQLSSSSNNNVQTESTTTNASGSANYNQLDYDVAGETIYVQVIAPDGTIVKSNSITWK
ncbi:fibronectin type III domain-containing protein [Amycolatopsis saalfeldensis]|uniref:fibronectin type III domain-containing protein n=1 Tax=Amycolatopsis saalfeldensis TaxID=394193 RepID=UPI0011608F86|nr:fibronectin type III domain-containing protein [Amycolatopsis saalfeldensis]